MSFNYDVESYATQTWTDETGYELQVEGPQNDGPGDYAPDADGAMSAVALVSVNDGRRTGELPGVFLNRQQAKEVALKLLALVEDVPEVDTDEAAA